MLEAVTHSSFANESPHLSPRDNERLEYLGDAVLQLITAEYLYKHHPGATEGELTQTRSAMVNTNTLALLAEQLDMGAYLYLGKGIAKGGGRNLKSLLANMFEAVLGAIFLDAGYDAAYHYYLNRYRSLPSPAQDENFKGRLQQVAQERFGADALLRQRGGSGRHPSRVHVGGVRRRRAAGHRSRPDEAGGGAGRREGRAPGARLGAVTDGASGGQAGQGAASRTPRAPRSPRAAALGAASRTRPRRCPPSRRRRSPADTPIEIAEASRRAGDRSRAARLRRRGAAASSGNRSSKRSTCGIRSSERPLYLPPLLP